MVAACMSMAERWNLAGATALVTGGSKGIGFAIVEELAGFGGRVHTCSRNAAELEECRRQWEQKGLQVTVCVCDVSVRADREDLMATVGATFGDNELVEFMPVNEQDYEEIIEEYEEEILVQEGAPEPFVADFVDTPPAQGST